MKTVLNTAKSAALQMLFFIGWSAWCFPQQDVIISQYYYNPLAINPGYCGIKNAMNIVALNRNQWTGFEGAPSTQSLTVQAPFAERKLGLGLQIINDKIGFRKNLGIHSSIAYKLIFNNVKLSFGLRGGIYRFQIDRNAVLYDDPGEPAFIDNLHNKTVPNFDFGTFLQTRKFFAGVSSSHINQPRLQSEALNPLKRHFFLMSGYVHPINENFRIIPSFLARFTKNTPVSVDAGAQAVYRGKIGAGISFRTDKSFVSQFNFSPYENLKIGYSFDYSLPFAQIKASPFTHEFFISYDLALYKTQTLHPKFL